MMNVVSMNIEDLSIEELANMTTEELSNYINNAITTGCQILADPDKIYERIEYDINKFNSMDKEYIQEFYNMYYSRIQEVIPELTRKSVNLIIDCLKLVLQDIEEDDMKEFKSIGLGKVPAGYVEYLRTIIDVITNAMQYLAA